MAGRVNELGLRFDENEFLFTLEQVAEKVGLATAAHIREVADQYKGEGKFTVTVRPESESGVKFWDIGSPDWLSFQSNYGRGSLMARDNPFLDAYISGPTFNRDRLANDMAIMGRPKGWHEIEDYDNTHGGRTFPRYSFGTNYGSNLEINGAEMHNNSGQGMFDPAPPKYWLERAFRSGVENIYTNWDEQWGNFIVSRFLEGGLR